MKSLRSISPIVPLAAAVILHVALAAAAWRTGPGMNSDSATGFVIWDAWRAGFGWNQQPYPDPANLARDLSLFQAWWSPGQYLAVAPLQLIGFNLGQAIAVGSLAWTLFGLAGWHRLFRTFGYTPGLTALSVLLIACNWTLVRNYGDYMGGDLILLGLVPWLLLGLRAAVQAGTLAAWLAIPFLVWIGLMAKNTFVPVAGGALVAALWPRLAKRRPREWLVGFAGIAATFLAGYGLYWFSFLRFGWHPGSEGLGHLSPDAPLNLCRLAGFPLGGLFSVQNLLGRIFLHPPAPLASGWDDLAAWLVPIGLGLGLAGAALIRRALRENPSFGRLLLFTTLASVALFAVFAATREAQGMEERFLRPCSFLFAPVVLTAIGRPGSWRWRGPLALLLAVGVAYGASSGPLRAWHLWRLDARGRRGISQTALGRDGLAALDRIDREAPPGALVVVTSPEIALDLPHVRCWATHLEMMPLAFVAPVPLHGQVSELIVIAGPGSRAGHPDEPPALLARFADYDAAGWTEQRIGPWSIFRHGPPR